MSSLEKLGYGLSTENKNRKFLFCNLERGMSECFTYVTHCEISDLMAQKFFLDIFTQGRKKDRLWD